MDRTDAPVLIFLLAGAILLTLLFCARSSNPAKSLGPAPEMGISSLLQAPSPSLSSLRELRGRAVVLEFWATWCDSCRETIPYMNKLRAAFSGRPVVFISVTNETREKVTAFLRDNPITGWIGIDEEGRLQRVWGVTGVPQVFIIDPLGRITLKISPSFLYASDIERALMAAPQKKRIMQ